MTDPVRIAIILAATAIFAVVFSDYKTCVILRIIDLGFYNSDRSALYCRRISEITNTLN